MLRAYAVLRVEYSLEMNRSELYDLLKRADHHDIRTQLTVGECSLLRAAADNVRLDFPPDEEWSQLKKRLEVWKSVSSTQQKLAFEGFPLFEARWKLIQAYQCQSADDAENSRPSNKGPAESPYAELIGNCIANVFSTFGEKWNYARLPKSKALDQDLIGQEEPSLHAAREPSFMQVVMIDVSLAQILRVSQIEKSAAGWE